MATEKTKKAKTTKAPTEEVKVVEEPMAPKKDKGTIRFVIQKREGDPDSIFVGVNGVGYQIQTGVPVDLPMAVYKVLETSQHQMSVAEASREKFKNQEITSL